MRATTRDAGRFAGIEASGIEPVIGDPDRVATIAPALEHVGIVCVLLASASGSPEALGALHGPRLEMLLSRTLDSTMHGLLYESRGSVDRRLLKHGTEIVRTWCEKSRVPYALLDADPDAYDEWVTAAVDAVDRLLRAR